MIFIKFSFFRRFSVVTRGFFEAWSFRSGSTSAFAHCKLPQVNITLLKCSKSDQSWTLKNDLNLICRTIFRPLFCIVYIPMNCRSRDVYINVYTKIKYALICTRWYQWMFSLLVYCFWMISLLEILIYNQIERVYCGTRTIIHSHRSLLFSLWSWGDSEMKFCSPGSLRDRRWLLL